MMLVTDNSTGFHLIVVKREQSASQTLTQTLNPKHLAGIRLCCSRREILWTWPIMPVHFKQISGDISKFSGFNRYFETVSMSPCGFAVLSYMFKGFFPTLCIPSATKWKLNPNTHWISPTGKMSPQRLTKQIWVSQQKI